MRPVRLSLEGEVRFFALPKVAKISLHTASGKAAGYKKEHHGQNRSRRRETQSLSSRLRR
jgi:hypothetical protein